MRQRRALITGGGWGAGFGIAGAMLEAGFHVTVTGLTEAEVPAVSSRPLLKCLVVLLLSGVPGLCTPANATDAPDAVCRTIAARYQALRDADKRAPEKPFAYPDSPLEALLSDPESGIRAAGHAVEFQFGYSRDKLFAWAESLSPPVVLPDDLVAAIGQTGDGGPSFVDRLPGQSYFAAGGVAGTLMCYSMAYFAVSDGLSRAAAAPPSWSDENGAGCAVVRSLGTVEGVPVAFEEAFDQGPELSSTVIASAWTDGAFGKACTVAFTFAARFSPRGTFNRWEEACFGNACEAMRAEAEHLIEAVQKGPQNAQQVARDNLTPQQQAAYDAILAAAPPVAGAETDPAALREDQPLRMPAVIADQVYLAELGHEAIGWRVYSDWSVAFIARDGDDTKEVARFAVGMAKGALLGVTVK